MDPYSPCWDYPQVIYETQSPPPLAIFFYCFYDLMTNLNFIFSVLFPNFLLLDLQTFRIQALANLNEDDLPDVALQVTQMAGSANTTWVIAKHPFFCVSYWRKM